MTINARYVAHHRQNLRDAATNAAALANELRDGAIQARTSDPDLTTEANTRRQEERAQAHRTAAQERVPAFRSGYEAARDYLLAEARANTVLPDDLRSVVIATQKWEGITRLLDAGADLRTFISTVTDVPTLLAIAEYGPMYDAARTYRGTDLTTSFGNAVAGISTDPAAGGAWVQRAVWTRLSEVTPDAALRDLLDGALEADSLFAIAEPWLEAAETFAATGRLDMVGAAVASGMAAQEHAHRGEIEEQPSPAAAEPQEQPAQTVERVAGIADQEPPAGDYTAAVAADVESQAPSDASAAA